MDWKEKYQETEESIKELYDFNRQQGLEPLEALQEIRDEAVTLESSVEAIYTAEIVALFNDMDDNNQDIDIETGIETVRIRDLMEQVVAKRISEVISEELNDFETVAERDQEEFDAKADFAVIHGRINVTELDRLTEDLTGHENMLIALLKPPQSPKRKPRMGM